MQHVKPKWLRNYAYSVLLVDILLFAGYYFLKVTNASQSRIDFWGITPMVLVIASVHIFITLVVYPLVRQYSEWAAFVTAMVPYGLLLSAVIETSGNTNLLYRGLFIILVFMLNMVGPYLAIASVVVAWIFLFFDFLNLGHPIPEVRALNIVIDIIVTISALAGWFFFKRYYIRDKETAAMANLLEQEQFKSSVILESITDGVVVVNTEGVTQIINASAANMFGWAKEEAKNLHYNSLYSIVEEETDIQESQKSQNDPNDVVDLVIKTGKPQQKVIQVQTRHNKRVFVDTVASPIYQDLLTDSNQPATKQLVGVIVVYRDVDQQKKQEKQRTEFISTASHEMRTPVAAIEGYLALAMNDKVCLVDEKARGYLEKAHASTQHLGQLFQDLLTSAKADDGRLTSHPQVVEMGGYLEHLTEDLRFTAQKKGLAMNFIMGSEDTPMPSSSKDKKVIKPLYFVEVDPDRLREVITNLVDNAVKYTPSGGVSIGLTGNKDVVQFYIKDTGSGIPPEDARHLFQKFYRVDNSATRTIGGTGLGLFICRKIVELYDGKIWIESKVGDGSTFFVNLPRLDSQKAQLLLSQKPAEASTNNKQPNMVQ